MSLNFLRTGGIAGIATGSATYFGATGTEIVKIVLGTVVTTDQNIERIEFSGNVSDYSFSVSGNQVKVLSNGAVIETFAAGGNNQVMAFADGSAPVVIIGLGAVTLGGSSIPAIAGPLLVAPTLNAADPSTVPALIASMTAGSSVINSPASLNFLSSNEVAGIVTGSATYFGATGTETVKIVPGTVVTTDQNIERIEFSGNVSAYTFSVSGNQVKVLSNGAVIETFAAGGNNQVMAFANGSAPVVITGLGVVALGGSSIPAIAGPLLVAPILNTADLSTVPALIAAMTGANVNITAANVSPVAAASPGDATVGNVTYTVAPMTSSYTYNIDGFASGDKLVFPAGTAESVSNFSGTDGSLTIAGTLGTNVVTINLTGVALAADSAIFNVNSFNTVFGAGSLTTAGVQTTSALTYSTTTFTEATANNGTIATTSTLTLTGDSFTGVAGSQLSVNASNLPAGLTASLVQVDATHAMLSLTGTATAHAAANSITNLSLALPATDFTKGVVATGAAASNLAVTFIDPFVINNIVYATNANDTITGGNGIDTVSYGNAPSAVTVNLAGLYDSKGSSLGYNTSGGSGHDVLTNLNNIIGSQYDDTITGNSANNVLSGGDGNDTLYGGDGNDTFYGGKGNDSLYGSKGADTFSYGASNGQGGSSNDGVDTIYGFSPSEDKIAIVSGTNGITTPALAFAHLSTNAAGAAVLDLGASNTVTLAGISVATLSSSIFIVGSESAVNITAAGSSSAATGNITFNITAGNYIYNISDFAAGDKLIFPQGPTPTVENTSFTDGSVDVIYAGSSGAATIHLTGLPAVQDGAILGITSFNSVFGSGALQQLAL